MYISILTIVRCSYIVYKPIRQGHFISTETDVFAVCASRTVAMGYNGSVYFRLWLLSIVNVEVYVLKYKILGIIIDLTVSHHRTRRILIQLVFQIFPDDRQCRFAVVIALSIFLIDESGRYGRF